MGEGRASPRRSGPPSLQHSSRDVATMARTSSVLDAFEEYPEAMREDAAQALLDPDHHQTEVAELMAAVIQAQQEQQHRLDGWLDDGDQRDDA